MDERASRIPAATEDTLIVLSIALSAGFYLFSYSSSIATAVNYFHFVKKNPSMVGVFGACVAFLSFGHLSHALIFKLKLSKQEQPLRAAYFFPLIQLLRLADMVRKRKMGFKSLESREKRILFIVVALAVDAIPILDLQFVMYLVRRGEGHGSMVLSLSLIASLVAATFNGAMSILSNSTHSQPLHHKAAILITGGTYTLATIFLRCTTITSLILWKGLVSPPAFIVTALTSYSLLFWKFITPTTTSTWRRLGNTAASSYMSFTIGPMYPVLNQFPFHDVRRRRAIVCMCFHHVLYDMAVLILSSKGPFHWSFYCKHFLTSSPCKLYIPLASCALVVSLASCWAYTCLENEGHELVVVTPHPSQHVPSLNGDGWHCSISIDMLSNRCHEAKLECPCANRERSPAIFLGGWIIIYMLSNNMILSITLD